MPGKPWTFAEPTSPHIVSAEKAPITLEGMSAGLRTLEAQADWVLVEGAGGWFTPLSETLTFADWVVAEQLPVILVVGVKLGCINHAMLTAQAIEQAGLRLRAGLPMMFSRRANAIPSIWRRYGACCPRLSGRSLACPRAVRYTKRSLSRSQRAESGDIQCDRSWSSSC
jgi:hypothetical protein